MLGKELAKIQNNSTFDVHLTKAGSLLVMTGPARTTPHSHCNSAPQQWKEDTLGGLKMRNRQTDVEQSNSICKLTKCLKAGSLRESLLQC